jgi:hypothetical protein
MPKPIDDFALQLDATIEQTARAIGLTPITVRRRIVEGRYQSYLDGRVRKVVVASVLADRAALIDSDNAGPTPPNAGKGRPLLGDKRLTPAERKRRWKDKRASQQAAR